MAVEKGAQGAGKVPGGGEWVLLTPARAGRADKVLFWSQVALASSACPCGDAPQTAGRRVGDRSRFRSWGAERH